MNECNAWRITFAVLRCNTLLHSGATNGTKSLRLDPYGVPPCRHGGLPPRPIECLLPWTSENPISTHSAE
jgi:hypothetical protein